MINCPHQLNYRPLQLNSRALYVVLYYKQFNSCYH